VSCSRARRSAHPRFLRRRLDRAGTRRARNGRVSAFAQWCGLDWQRRSYLPLVMGERGRGDRALAAIALLHGAAQGRALDLFRAQGRCGAAERADVERRLAAAR
jgi:hypothetical protein